MPSGDDDKFAGVDALLAAVNAGTVLPVPAERVRLREAAGLTVAAVAQALGTRGPTLESWEAGRSEPTGDKLAAYRRLLEGLAQRYPATPAPVEPTPTAPAPAATPGPDRTEPVQPAPTAPTTPRPPVAAPMPPERSAQPSPPTTRTAAPSRRPASTPARTGSRPAAQRPAESAARWWPAVALDAAPDRWVLDVPQVPAPAGPKLTDVLAWLGTGLPLRIERIHAAGRGGDGIVVLTAGALTQLGLPVTLPSTDKALAALQAKLAKAAASVGMEVSEQIGPTFHAFRRKGAAGGPRTSLRVLVAPWLGQGDARQQATSSLAAPLATGVDGSTDGLTLARRIRAFTADLGVAPGASTATTAMLLLDAVRPRIEWERDETTGEWTHHLRDGALPAGDLCVAPAAGARHPLTRQLLSEGGVVCEEEDYKWWARPLTAEEATRRFAVAVDVCASYLSVTESLRLPVGPLKLVKQPVWDEKTAGLWWADFTTTPVDELLPHPATFHGMPPTGPGWYATPTVAYMASAYGFDPGTITEAYLSTHTAPMLKEWTGRLRAGYKRTYAVLGLVDGLGPEAFLDIYALHKDIGTDEDLADALTLAKLYKNVYKGGIGKWSDSARHLDDQTWLEKVAASWAYRPEIRFHIIAAARIAAHRRLRKTLQLTGRAPFAVNVDSYLYATDAPSPIELLPVKDDGSPVPGALRLGIAPGSHKHESSFPLAEAVAAMEQQVHPSRLVHQYGTDGNPISDAQGDDVQEEGEF
ncbi:helix-turn-helix domain-containing protein [Streptacidiphilus melanogenes]|uniref:helix-turn-helix domain-containing protein n=1 Tax=Streptacidiphilus melanogenes TaxID=411235 RepID=UPI0005A8A1AD|nr:helix-turn-helix transcriptional regulator [Streptacidiphilus melanogenes]